MDNNPTRTKRPSRKGVKLGRRLVNKSQRIRETAQRMIEEGRPPRPIEIVDILAAEGIHVRSGQVCVALRGRGLQLKDRQSIPRTSMEDLRRVDALSKEIGRERLLAAVEVYRTLEGEGTRSRDAEP